MQDKTLSLTIFSKQRKKKREGECPPLHGINRFSRLGQSFHVLVPKQYYQGNQFMNFELMKNSSDCWWESKSKTAKVKIMGENCCLDQEISTSLVA